MYRLRFAALVLALAGLGALAVPAATVSASTTVPTLTQIRATHHPGYDRLVFEFRGRVPTHHGARYVSQVVGPSGLPVHIVGSALLRVQFSPTLGHNAQGGITYGPARRTYALPNIIQVVNAEDFEAVLSFGVGLARQEPFHMFTLTNPSRVVIDVRTPYRTVSVRRLLPEQPPVRHRPQPLHPAGLPAGDPARRRVWRLAAAVRRADPGRAGAWAAVRRVPGDRVQEPQDQRWGGTGPADRRLQHGGSTFTVADEIRPTLKQFGSVAG